MKNFQVDANEDEKVINKLASAYERYTGKKVLYKRYLSLRYLQFWFDGSCNIGVTHNSHPYCPEEFPLVSIEDALKKMRKAKSPSKEQVKLNVAVNLLKRIVQRDDAVSRELTLGRKCQSDSPLTHEARDFLAGLNL